LAVLLIKGELPAAVLAAALPLAWLAGADGLLRMKSGRLERPPTKRATPQIHTFTLTVPHRWGVKGETDQDLRLRNLSWEKILQLPLYVRETPPVGRLTAPQQMQNSTFGQSK
jgi:hypothetical protein